MNEYDGLFIVDPAPGKDGTKEIVQWLSDSIAKQGGQIEALNEWGKRKLAYRVKKRLEAYYIQIDFKAKPAAIAVMEGQYRLNDEILKFMVLRREPGTRSFVPFKKSEGESAYAAAQAGFESEARR